MVGLRRWVLALVAAAAWGGCATGLTFNVDPGKDECLFEDIHGATRVSGSFQVTNGGFLDIDAKVTGPDEKTIYSVQKETEGRFTFMSHETGTYRFCFGNSMSTVTPKTVSFSLLVGEETQQARVAKSGESKKQLYCPH
eukprot:766797-Hanusia_phi.AAC.5